MISYQGSDHRTEDLPWAVQSQHDNSTLLIFHGAVYPMLVDCKFGGDHANAMGKRTHIIQLNKAALHIMLEWGALPASTPPDLCWGAVSGWCESAFKIGLPLLQISQLRIGVAPGLHLEG